MRRITESINYIDLFGGIGGFRHGLEQASDKYECVGYYDKDKYTVKSYNRIFKENHEPVNVSEVDAEKFPDHDVLCAGFPCQSFSIAGNREGFEDTRGTLFFEIARIARAKKPKILLLENVKGLLSHDDGRTFGRMLQALDELGYYVEWQVLNSKHWGVPQNRERVFIIGHLGGEPRRKVFPIARENRGNPEENGQSVSSETLDTVHKNRPEIGQADRVYKNDGLLPALNGGWTPQIQEEKEIDEIANRYGKGKQDGGFYNKEGVSPTLPVSKGGANPFMVTEEGLNTTESGDAFTVDASYFKGMSLGNKGSGRRTQIINHQFRPESRPSVSENAQSGGLGLLYNSDYSYNPMFTLTGQDIHGVTENKKRIRKLTPRECWRLQGFPDKSFEAAQEVNSDTQLYKQAGNAVTVNVIKALGEEIKEYFNGEEQNGE